MTTTTDKPVRVLCVDDHAFLVAGLRARLDIEPSMEFVGRLDTANELVSHVRRTGADIVLMDIGLPGMNGIEAAQLFKQRAPTARVVMLTVHEEDEKVFEAICAGASGYLLKPASPKRVVQAVRDVRNGAAPINGYIAGKVLGMFARLAAPGPEELPRVARRKPQVHVPSGGCDADVQTDGHPRADVHVIRHPSRRSSDRVRPARSSASDTRTRVTLLIAHSRTYVTMKAQAIPTSKPTSSVTKKELSP